MSQQFTEVLTSFDSDHWKAVADDRDDFDHILDEMVIDSVVSSVLGAHAVIVTDVYFVGGHQITQQRRVIRSGAPVTANTNNGGTQS